jgi:hypothetical protein
MEQLRLALEVLDSTKLHKSSVRPPVLTLVKTQ